MFFRSTIRCFTTFWSKSMATSERIYQVTKCSDIGTPPDPCAADAFRKNVPSQPRADRYFYLSEDAQAVVDADFEEIRPHPKRWREKLTRGFTSWLMLLRF